ncbi:putative toxin-antitoxin system toxin component, PIN family [Parabacteroides sp. AF17-28]|uniref:putative toxin-antitoxin system toxin component, PIN family n=1 Tax=Parabacteroides sp. AF17-28 TaxID=2292241 RepID=UPI000EFEF823|nr:putative toxin-antitoxin system toxin component, PIN family [Parabacteroides sp. AF17-28]RHR58308.1 putative toxin-antitoxin system toxin component, PIN family [Parabacteroides sp. AF17-28]
MKRIVLDTNCLLMSLSRKGCYYSIWSDFFTGKYILCYTNDILEEYEEIISMKMGNEIAQNIIKAIITRTNTLKLDAHFHFNLIKSDIDDNKFVDCAIVANASYIVSEDHHFEVLKTIDFPKVELIDIDTFIALLKNE